MKRAVDDDYCPYCGKQLAGHADHCPYCQEYFDYGDETITQKAFAYVLFIIVYGACIWYLAKYLSSPGILYGGGSIALIFVVRSLAMTYYKNQNERHKLRQEYLATKQNKLKNKK